MFLTGFFLLLLLHAGGRTEPLEKNDEDTPVAVTPSDDQPISTDDPHTPSPYKEEMPDFGPVVFVGNSLWSESTETREPGGKTEADPYTEEKYDQDMYSFSGFSGPGFPPRQLDTELMRGLYDGSKYDDTYYLDIENPPEYLKEYYASFRDEPERGKIFCNYDEISSKLGLSSDNPLLTMSRPVLTHRTLTYIYLEMVVAGILNVRETDQTFTSHIRLYMAWDNKFIRWKPEKHCGIKHIIVPADLLWKPDIVIEEMIEKDKNPPSPYLKINSYGEVEYRNDMLVVSHCKMDVYKFPFDVQRCTISFKSLMHSDTEIRFVVNQNSTVVTKWAHLVMETQYEWLFLKMTVTNTSAVRYFGLNQTTIVYTIYMKRRSVLYVVNFLLPLFFFLCMDLASFLIPNGEGEKISFKVTVLLAVTVMQLIFNEILPNSSDKVPLIAVYCIGIFILMLLSLLETIVNVHLMEKDSVTQDKERDGDPNLTVNKQDSIGSNGISKELKTSRNSSSLSNLSADQTPSVTTEVRPKNCSNQTEVALSVGRISADLDKMEESSVPRKEEKEKGYWSGVAQTLNRGFFTLYVVTIFVFFVDIISIWTSSDEDQF